MLLLTEIVGETIVKFPRGNTPPAPVTLVNPVVLLIVNAFPPEVRLLISPTIVVAPLQLIITSVPSKRGALMVKGPIRFPVEPIREALRVMELVDPAVPIIEVLEVPTF